MLLIYIPLALLMLLVFYYDIRYYIIPNWLNLALLALYPVLWAVQMPEPWWSGLLAMAVMLLVGIGMYAIGMMGGGDIKLLTVLMLWMGWGLESVQFLLVMSILGGLLAVLLILLRRSVGRAMLKRNKRLPRLLMQGQPIPYGVAIAGAFLLMLQLNQVPALVIR